MTLLTWSLVQQLGLPPNQCVTSPIFPHFQLTRAPKEVSGYSVRFHRNFLTLPTLVGPKSSTVNLSIYFRSDSIWPSISWNYMSLPDRVNHSNRKSAFLLSLSFICRFSSQVFSISFQLKLNHKYKFWNFAFKHDCKIKQTKSFLHWTKLESLFYLHTSFNFRIVLQCTAGIWK